MRIQHLRILLCMPGICLLMLSVEQVRAQEVPEPAAADHAPGKTVDKTVDKTEKSPVVEEQFNIPLRFDVLGDGVKMLPLKFEYELIDDSNLKVSDVFFNQNSFLMGIFPAGKMSPLLNQSAVNFLGKDKEGEALFLARWPQGLMQAGTIEAINRSGRTLWKIVVTDADLEAWSNQLEVWKKRLLENKVAESEIKKIPLFSTQFAIRDFAGQKQPFWNLNEPFRFCLSTEAEDGQYSRMCTRYLEARKDKKNNVIFIPFPQAAKKARVIAFNEPAKNKASKEVKVGELVQFFAELSSGATLEFVSRPAKFNLVEMLEPEGQPDLARIVAWGPRPSRKVEEMKIDVRGFLEKLIGKAWTQTIGDFRQFWQVTLPQKNATLHIPGTGGGLFRLDFEISKIPSEKIRPWVDRYSVDGTYIDGVKVYGKSAKGTKLSSTMNSLSVGEADGQEFTWEFAAKNPGFFNKSYVLVEDDGKTYKAYREIFRGFGREVSSRLTGLAGTGGNLILMGEFAFNYWFENILGWNQHFLSRQRWGISAKYFKSFNNLNLGTTSNTLQNITADLKYRLDPGLWSRDETWGIQLNSNATSFDVFQAQLFGLGLFWGRSMPKVFNDIFNNLPYMRYPKWVDMEFIYYPMTTTPGVTLLNIGQGYGNWQLNFHGKVMWGKQFFGEAGFGLKQLDFQQRSTANGLLRQRFQFTSFYGTLGLGWSF